MDTNDQKACAIAIQIHILSLRNELARALKGCPVNLEKTEEASDQYLKKYAQCMGVSPPLKSDR